MAKQQQTDFYALRKNMVDKSLAKAPRAKPIQSVRFHLNVSETTTLFTATIMDPSNPHNLLQLAGQRLADLIEKSKGLNGLHAIARASHGLIVWISRIP